MDEKTQGLVLKLIDYKDADKLASIFTFNYGVVTAKFVGVKKEKAKLKAVAQPFTFADFNFTMRANNRVVAGASLIDNFYQLMLDYNKTICGYIVLDILKSILPEEKPEQDLILLAVSTLKNIEQNNEYVAVIDFILKFLNFTGFNVELPQTDYVYFNKDTAEFSVQRTHNCTQIDKNVYGILKKISNNEIEAFNEKTLKQILRLLHNIIFNRFGVEIKSFEFI
ncbi:MAG: DNA repair protein RecO [Clostridia bacterium]|nr:DNA repair protein RecO [Clostridia bacterium]